MTLRMAVVLVSMCFVLGACENADDQGGKRDAETPNPDGGHTASEGGLMDAGPDAEAQEDAAAPMDAGRDAGPADAGGTDAGDAAHGADAGPGDAASGTSFTRVYAIITASCSPCHTENATPSGGLDMRSKASAYAELVDKAAEGAACSSSGGVRVVPGDPEGSLLIHKLEGVDDDDDPVCGSRMPFNRAPLAPALIAEIAAWIEAGALND